MTFCHAKIVHMLVTISGHATYPVAYHVIAYDFLLEHAAMLNLVLDSFPESR